MGSAGQIKAVASKIQSLDSPSIVVLSAISGTAESLAEIASLLRDRNPEGARNSIAREEKKCCALIEELFSTAEAARKAKEYVRDVFAGMNSFSRDFFSDVQEHLILAQGELLSTFLIKTILEEQGVAAKQLQALSFMRIDRHGEPDMDAIKTALVPLLEGKATLYLTEGSICMNSRGEVDELGQGGADYTACIIGAAIDAGEIQIWKDTSMVQGASEVKHLHFEEAAELAYFGADILHPTCILPARDANVPVRLLSTAAPDSPGTLIDNRLDPGTIKAVAAKDNIVAIKIKSSRMLLAHGFLRKVFEIFESYCTPIDMICTSEVGVSLTIDDTRYLGDIIRDLKKYGIVSVDLDMCIVCVVGDMDWSNRGLESRVLGALKDIPVRMVSYGGSNFNISILVRAEDKAETLGALSNNLFSK